MDLTKIKRENVILSGVQRAGTTLACHLLNKLPDVVALHEPMNVSRFPTLGGPPGICNEIDSFFGRMRDSILLRKVALSKNVGGKIPDNHMSTRADYSVLRKDMSTLSEIVIDKELDQNFTLVIKHPAAFTAILGSLVKRFNCYAVIRNPLSTLSSWNSISMPAGNGYLPAAEILDSKLHKKLARMKDRYDRQLYILSWFFEKYLSCLPDDRILRYEEIISSGGQTLKPITPAADRLNEKLTSRNRNVLYSQDTMKMLAEKLLNSKGAYWEFYSKKSVEDILS